MARMRNVRFVISIVLLFCASLASGQVSNDFGVWISGSYSKDIVKNVEFKANQEFRLDESATRLKKSYSTVAVEFEYIEWVHFQFNYRFILNQKSDGSFGQRHRIMGDVIFRPINGRFSLSNRVRFQSEIRTINYSEKYGFAPASNLRNTIKASYRINRKFEPYAHVDFRFLVRDARTPYHTGFDRHRIKAGVDITLARKRALDLYLMTSRHWNVVEPSQVFVVGINYSFGGFGRMFD